MATTSFTRKTLGLEAGEPAVTPPTGTAEPTFVKKPKLSSAKSRKRDIPEGLWTKCPKCSTMIYDKELDENLKVCPKCGHHFRIGARERIHSLVETCSFTEMDSDLESMDVLRFTGAASYKEKLESHKRATGLKDAVITGIGNSMGRRSRWGSWTSAFSAVRWVRSLAKS
jgi:acetyl-CoA carboxylase carboxyl transferase subunit beta